MKHHQKLECWINKRRMCEAWKRTRKSEKISSLFLLFFLQHRQRQQQRGEINVRNNKILRTSETRGDFFPSNFSLFPFFIATLLCFLISLSLSHFFLLPPPPLSTNFWMPKAVKNKKNEFNSRYENVRHNFLLFSTFICRNYNFCFSFFDI